MDYLRLIQLAWAMIRMLSGYCLLLKHVLLSIISKDLIWLGSIGFEVEVSA